MSPHTADAEDANRLPTIPEESLNNAQPGDAIPHDLNSVNGLPTDGSAPEPSEAAVPGWIAENNQLDENLQPASVAPPAATDESHPPPPYPVSE